MEVTTAIEWHPALSDPTGRRAVKPRTSGKTMVIDKGLGLNAFDDLLATAADHIDMIKIGFGTSPLYPQPLLRSKIELATQYGIVIYPGGTFLEAALAGGVENDYFHTIHQLGFTGIEISDGTIDIDRVTRSRLISRAVDAGFTVLTEYGKKCWGSVIEVEALIYTVLIDRQLGAELVTVEGRESGAGVGIYDEKGGCKDEPVLEVLELLPCPERLLWEAPQKDQQVHLLKLLGHQVNLGNIASQDVLSLEALRRGLRSDTFVNV